jgi:anti-sigma B factor antagonist
MAIQLAIGETHAGDVTLLTLAGRLVADEEDTFFADRVNKLLAAGRIRIVADLREVSSIDSGGVGTLVAKLLSARRRGGDLRLLRPSDRSRRVLEITRLIEVFQVFESEDEALASFGPQVAHR